MINNPGAALLLTIPTGSPTRVVPLPASAIPGIGVGSLTTVYVDQPTPVGRGDDATGVRGNEALPFATLDAAIAAMQDGDTLCLISGTFAPPSAPFPDALKNGSIVTWGNASNAAIDATGTGLPCIDLSVNAPGGTRNGWQVFTQSLAPSIRLIADVGVPAFKADGTNAPAGGFFPQTLAIAAVWGGGIEVKYANTLIIAGGPVVNPDAWTLFNCGQVFVIGAGSALFLGGPAALDVTYDTNDPLTPIVGGPLGGGIGFFGSVFYPSGTIKLVRQASLFASTGVVLPDVISQLPDVGVGPGFARTSINMNARVQVGSINVTFVDSPAGNPKCECRGIELLGASVIKVAGVGTNRVEADFTGSIVHNVLEFRAGIDAKCRGVSSDNPPSTALKTVDSATLIPPDGAALDPVAAAALTQNVLLPWTLPLGLGYTATVSADNPATLPLSVRNYGQLSFDVDVSVAVGNLSCVLSFRG